MGAATIAFMGMSLMVPRRNRVFHYITGKSIESNYVPPRLLTLSFKAAITLVASIAYFTMASNLGYAAIPVEFMRSNPKVAGNFREIFYVRYIDWFVTTPVSNPITSARFFA
jgi:bacteriorhodopsin